MPAEFEILFRFLELADGEVQGRQSARPPADIKRLVLAFLSGQLAEEQRIELCEELRGQPAWLAWFAEQIKKRRNSAQQRFGQNRIDLRINRQQSGDMPESQAAAKLLPVITR
jgi:hypothetical protein